MPVKEHEPGHPSFVVRYLEATAPLIVFLICAAITAVGWIWISRGGGDIFFYLGCIAVFVGPLGLLLGEAAVLGDRTHEHKVGP